ncbi:MAG: M1 family aminopeptidase [Candidatus Sumerlaeaceae bacterium]
MPNRVRRIAEALFTLTLLLHLATTTAAPIDITGRYTPFLVTADNTLSGTETAVAPSSELHLHADLSVQNAARVYGLLATPLEKSVLRINGRKLNTLPLARQDGMLFLVDPMYLKSGTNHIDLERPSGASLPWAGTMMFTLDGTSEEAHFAEAFDDRPEDARRAVTKQLPIDSRLNNYDILSYDCTWKPDMFSSRLLAGSSVTIRAKALINSFSQFVVDFDMNTGGNPDGNGAPSGMVISSIDQGPSTGNLTFSTDTANNLLLITLPAPISSNTEFTLRVNYSGYPNDIFPKQIFGGPPAYTAETHVGTSPVYPVVYTASQPYGTRRWLPCKDTPADKATTSIQRLIVPNNLGYALTAISNGKLASVTNNGDGTDTHVWVNSYPIATYLLALYVSNYTLVTTTYTALDTVTTMPVGHYLYPENLGTEGNGHLGTLQVMNFYRDKFGEYPFVNEKYQTATWNLTFGIEHQTCTGMPEGSTAGVGNGFTRRNVHELAHQWFGDKVTCSNWDHVWLNEGFATYCEALVTEQFGVYGTYAAYVNNNFVTPPSPAGSISTGTPVVNSNGDDFAGSVVYRKGAWVLHMLRHVLGDAIFFQALRNYVATGYTTSTSQPPGTPVDFQSVCEGAAGLSAGSLAPFFTQWLSGFSGGIYSNQPVYGAHGNMTSGTTTQVSLAINQTQSGLPYNMPIDVQFTDANNNQWISVVPNSTSTNTTTLNTSTSYPLEMDIDPDNWILNGSALTLNTVGLPQGAPGVSYNRTLRASGGTSPRTFTYRPGSTPPAWLSLSPAGVLSGTPPAAGIYIVPVRVTDSAGTPATRDSDLNLYVVSAAPPPAPPTGLVINELMYDNYGAASDVGEFVELVNSTGSAIDISNYQVVLVNSSGVSYSPGPISIPASTSLIAGGYYVIGNQTTIDAVFPGAVDQNVNLNNLVSDGPPAAVVLRDSFGQRVDSVCYRADATMTGGADFAHGTAEGGVGRSTSRALGTAGSSTIGRLPNGVDTGSNVRDFEFIVASPGSANSGGVTLPFSDNFDSGANSAWHFGFATPVRTATLGAAGKPPTDVAAGVITNALEVVDNTGGGDVNFLPGAFNQLNFSGRLWIPQTLGSNAWSTGVGIATRCESAWFQDAAGGGIENGFYLEYQNGPLGGSAPLENGALASHADTVKFFAVSGSPSLNTGPGSSVLTELGSATPTPSTWMKFRLIFDVPNNRLYAAINDTTLLYNGTIPAGTYNTSGGVTVGFREQHTGLPSSANTEGTWVDNVVVDTNTAVITGISNFELY